MSPASHADPDLDTLIWEITADCNDEEEVLMGFEGAFDEDGSFPCPGTVVGERSRCYRSARAMSAAD